VANTDSVCILGAGASRACSSQTPVVKEFFSVAESTTGTSKEMFEGVCKYLKKEFGMAAQSLIEGKTDLERVFSLVQAECDMTDDFKAARSLNSILDLIYEVLTTKSWKELTSTGDLYDQLVARSDSATYVSFNYDLQLDRALERGGMWSVIDGYGFEFRHFRNEEGKGAPRCQRIESSTKLLKLHGPLNWLRSTGFFLDGSTMDFTETLKGRHYLTDCLYRFTGDPDWNTTPSITEDNKTLPLEFNIVPPVMSKRLSGDPKLEPITLAWRLARTSLAAARKIAIVGYSLPLTDFYSEWLLRRAISENTTSIIHLDIVNPCQEVRDRLAGLFANRAVTRHDFKDFAAYINQLNDTA